MTRMRGRRRCTRTWRSREARRQCLFFVLFLCLFFVFVFVFFFGVAWKKNVLKKEGTSDSNARPSKDGEYLRHGNNRLDYTTDNNRFRENNKV
jgi:hypothetical protein